MTTSLLVLSLSGIFYALATVFHLMNFLDYQQEGHQRAAWMLKFGFLSGTAYFVLEAMYYGAFLPVGSHDQAVAFFAWSLAFVYLVLLAGIQSKPFGLILNPVLFGLTAVAALTKAFCVDSQKMPIRPELMHIYFTVHVLTAFFAYACCGISFAASIFYLIQNHELKSKRAGHFYHKLPSLEDLERLIYQPLVWGTALLGSAVGIGMLWARAACDEAMTLDPKTLTTAVICFFYGLILFLHFRRMARGKQIAVWSILAFTLVMIAFIGLRFVPGAHYCQMDQTQAAEPVSLNP